ncbi:hypothetical protein Q4485_10330 [Granulosicoccaceae sp. 1_MG-2023]|nr:hypothetical protein [Granulosicoccaceae sp. 1_MG-2023]
MQKRALATAVMAATVMPLSWQSAQAQEVFEEADYLAIHVEAEEFSENRAVAAGFQWYLFDQDNSPEVPPDDDEVDYLSASGEAFMELLPDRRKNGDERDLERADENGVVGGLWLTQGSGPTLTYAVNFPEPGRYVVHARTTGHGTEDNSVFVGIDGNYENAGPIQVCIPLAEKGSWVWRYQQRTADAHCGDTDMPAVVDVDAAGVHNVQISAREDGVEFDSFFLIKDKSEDTRICSPSAETDISCRNGSFSFPDEFVDFAVTSAAADVHAQAGDTLSVNYTVTNHDLRDASAGVVLEISLPEGVSLVDDAEGQCSAAGNLVSCDLGYMAAKASQDIAPGFRFDTVGSAVLSATVSSNKTDQDPSNNSDTLELTVSAAGPDVDLALSMASDKNTLAVGDTATLTLRVSNQGSASAEDVVVSGTLPAGLSAQGNSCTVSGQRFECSPGTLAGGASALITLNVDFSAAGEHELSASVSAAYDYDAGNDSDELSVYASSGVLFEEQDGLLVAEAEQFAVHSPADANSGWFLHEDGDVLALISRDLDDENASALPAEAALTYRVFFNTPGQYYVGVRASTAVSAAVSVALDGDALNGGLLAFCAEEDAWQWSGAGADGQCELSETLELTVAEAGEHRITIATAYGGLALDKFMISAAEVTTADGAGLDATVYSDKAVDLSLTSETSSLDMVSNEVSELAVTVTNLTTAYAATDIRILVSGLPGISEVTGDQSRCDLLVSDSVGQCSLGTLAPGESRDVIVPLKTALAGEADISLTLSAAQDDEMQANNALALGVDVAPGESAGAAAGQSSGGAVGWWWLLCAGLWAAARRTVRKQ